MTHVVTVILVTSQACITGTPVYTVIARQAYNFCQSFALFLLYMERMFNSDI